MFGSFVSALAVLTAAPVVHVTGFSERAGTKAAAPAVLELVRAALVARGLEVESLEETGKRLGAAGLKPRACGADPTCGQRLADAFAPGSVTVAVDIGKLSNEFVVRVEAYQPGAAASLTSADFTLSTLELTRPPAELDAFARELAAKRKPPETTRAPEPNHTVAVTLTPSAAVVEPPVTASRTVDGWALGTSIGAGLLAGAAAVSLAVSFEARAKYQAVRVVAPDGLVGTSVTLGEAKAFADRANGGLVGAVVGLVAALMCGGLSVWLWST